MEIIECKVSLRSQCPWDWLITQAETIGGRQFTTI